MTSLRTFQNEIEEIHTRETAKQRAQVAADKEKEKKSHTKAKAGDDKVATQDTVAGLGEVKEEEIQVSSRTDLYELPSRVCAEIDIIRWCFSP